MTAAIWHKELTEYRRDRRALALAIVLFALLLAAALDGWNRASADAQARSAAEATDREIWTAQGENNPHGAAHFARYAFRDTPALAAFDPGVFDYAGTAFWMEAHTQNPTTLRRAEDAAFRAPFASLSPAWVIQVVGTLVIATLLFGAVAAERDRGTLRTLAAAGVSAREFAAGKLVAAGVLVAGLTAAAVLTAVVPALSTGGVAPPIARVLALLLIYFAALLAFAFLVVWISARAASASSAFHRAALAWLTLVLLLPVFAGQLATTFYPDIDAQELKNDIQLKANAPFWSGDAQEAAVATYEQQVLEEYGAESFDDLGFNRDALVLQSHEEFANEIYDEIYGALKGRHQQQDGVLRALSLLSPVLAVQRLSAGIAGTDLVAQQTFADAAEAHRRKIIGELNRNMMVNAGDEGYAYMADKALWEAIPDFSYVPPALPRVLATHALEIVALLGWLVAFGLLALRATRDALARGA